ncbi:MAG: S-methyl-5-thioribose-1-phosphate isomerase [Dehalococcoidia bacterium]|nr:S-methyl-5-thioribose-1-phosphate isomerase [Dehalococcoidia bacterium]
MTAPYEPPYEPIAWVDRCVRLLDQTLLPHEVRYIDLPTVEAVAEAIEVMRVRGAPAIGITAAYGLALAACLAAPGADGSVLRAVEDAAVRLGATRPTAVNLRWALDRVTARVREATGDASAVAAAIEEAQRIHEEQRRADEAMAGAGANLLAPGSTVLTHCNTGALATGGLGTALGVIIEGYRRGLVRHVLVDETRPRLQGARLTAWELAQHGVPHEVIADGAAASLMAGGEVAAVIVGADRIAANGDTANKVGTYGAAIAARYHSVPFYVAAPLSTVDPATPSGGAIPIEERDASEVLAVDGHPVAPEGTRARNPAFDVTPAALIDGIVTERGVLRPPFATSIASALAEALAGAVPGTAGG